MTTTKLVTIARFQGLGTATVARNRLTEAGISSFLADAETINTDWLLRNALGGIKLQVPSSEAEQVRELLAYQLDDSDQAAMVEEAIDAGDEATEPHGADEDVPAMALTSRKELAQRAWRGSLLSLAFPPVFFLIAWMLLRVYLSNEPLEQPYRQQAWYAALITLPFILLALMTLRYFVMALL